MSSKQTVARGRTVNEAESSLLGPDSDRTPVLSIVMPTLDEQMSIAECIKHARNAVEELDVPAEIIVSDSSTDHTPEIARDLGAIVVKPDEPGYGYAYHYAFERARGEYVAIGDADTTYDFEELPKLMERVSDGGADMVMGSRLQGEILPGAMPPLHRYVGNPLLTKFLNVFYGTGVGDAHSGFRIVTREGLDQLDLQTNGMEFASEMIMEADARGLTIEEVPITYHPRQGEATLESFRDGWRHVEFMLVNAPGYLFVLPGLALTGIGWLVMTAAALGVHLDALDFGHHAAIAGGILTIVGVQIAFLGLLAASAGRSKRRAMDRLADWFLDRVDWERETMAGLGLFVAGAIYAGHLAFEWSTTGSASLSLVVWDIVAVTVAVLGVQLVFSSCFAYAVAE